MREFLSYAELVAHYRAVRQRIITPPNMPPPASDHGRRRQWRQRILSEAGGQKWDYRPPLPYDHCDLRHMPTRPALRKVSDIIREVARKHGVSVAELLGECRAAHLNVARHEAMYRASKERPDLSHRALGREFRRDRTTVLAGIRRHELRMRLGQA